MNETIGITLEQVDGYEFRVRFDKDSIAALTTELDSRPRLPVRRF